jgi:hypothetical protein
LAITAEIAEASDTVQRVIEHVDRIAARGRCAATGVV